MWKKRKNRETDEEIKQRAEEAWKDYVKTYISEKEEIKKSFINQGGNKFLDISSETKRIYKFLGGDEIVIHNPIYLCVKDNGHRVWDAQKVSHYIPTGWIHLKWDVIPGKPNFVK